MISLHTKVVSLLAFGVLLFVAVAFGGGIYMLQSLRSDTEESRREIQNAQLREVSLAQLARNLEATEASRNELRTYVLPQDGIIDFLSLVEDLGLSEGTEVSTAAITALEEKDTFESFQIDIKVSGSREGVLRVLALLETLPYASHIAKSTLRTTEGELGRRMEGDFTLVVAMHTEI